jgi:hypothetical protein
MLGTITTVERVVFHAKVYGGPGDVALHLSWAILTDSLACLILHATVWCAFELAARLARKLTWQAESVGVIVGALAGALVTAAAYWSIVVPSRYCCILPSWAGSLLALLLGGVAGAVGLPTFQNVRRSFPKITATFTLAVIVPSIAIDLHRYVRSYGNVHLFLGVGLLLGASILGSEIAAMFTRRTVRLSARATISLFGGSLGLLLVSGPTPGARMAVLQYGGIEKTVIRHFLWPIFDKDGDGFAAGPWGTDCTDSDASVHPLGMPPRSPGAGCRQFVSVQATSTHTMARTTPPRAHQSLVWVVVDTLRRDVTTTNLQHFPGFAMLPNYRSCGSDTRGVLTQLLGSTGCRPAVPHASLVSELRAAGLETACFVQYKPASLRMHPGEIEDVFGAFTRRNEGTNEHEVLHEASDWIREQEAQHRAFFAFVHLWGGHAPYGGQGDSDWERYADATSKTLRAVSDFLRSISQNHFVIVMGDHGEEFGEHDGAGHAFTLYEEVLSAPLLIRGPHFPINERSCVLDCQDLVALAFQAVVPSDAPTAFCDRKPYDRFARADYPSTDARGVLASHVRSVHLPTGLKVIWNLNLDVWELYDLVNDPGEKTNLATRQPGGLKDSFHTLFSAMQDCESDRYSPVP